MLERADIVNIKRPRKSRLPKTLGLWNEKMKMGKRYGQARHRRKYSPESKLRKEIQQKEE